MTKYRTRDGDMLDAICQRYYGGTSGIVEKVLEANRDLSLHDPILPSGLVINLPDLPKPQHTIKLWG